MVSLQLPVKFPKLPAVLIGQTGQNLICHIYYGRVRLVQPAAISAGNVMCGRDRKLTFCVGKMSPNPIESDSATPAGKVS